MLPFTISSIWGGTIFQQRTTDCLDCELLRLGKVWQQPDVRADRFPFGLKSLTCQYPAVSMSMERVMGIEPT